MNTIENFREEVCSSCKYDGYAQDACIDAWESAPECFNSWASEINNESTFLISELIYQNYMHNRQLSPQVLPEQWGAVFGNTDKMEARYQTENAIQLAKMK